MYFLVARDPPKSSRPASGACRSVEASLIALLRHWRAVGKATMARINAPLILLKARR
jgi:hypothetical protein